MTVEPVADNQPYRVALAIKLVAATKIVLQLLWRILPKPKCW
jgi:hypothetical protein